MSSNSTAYSKKYYETVTKPKRQKASKKLQKEIKQAYTGEITLKRVCPKCGEEWIETVVWKAKRRPSLNKICPKCSLKAALEYQAQPHVKAKTNARNRKNYANSAELRARKRACTYRWIARKRNNGEEPLT